MPDQPSTLSDYLQLVRLSMQSVVLVLRRNGRSLGRVEVVLGEPVEAITTDDRVGREALDFLKSLRGCDIDAHSKMAGGLRMTDRPQAVQPPR